MTATAQATSERKTAAAPAWRPEEENVRREWLHWPLQEVLPSEWTWAFDVKTGRFRTLSQKWEHIRDLTGRSKERLPKDKPENPERLPTLPFKDVETVCDDAEKTGDPLKDAWLRSRTADQIRDLTGAQLESLALAPNCRIRRESARAAAPVDAKAAAAEMLARVRGSSE